MNTQAILKILDEMYKKGPRYRSDGYNIAIREIKEYILEMEEQEDDGLLFGGGDRKGEEIFSLPSLDIDSQWIDVKERLPEEGKIVLINEGGIVIHGYMEGGTMYKLPTDKLSYCNHWMPLPLPPNN